MNSAKPTKAARKAELERLVSKLDIEQLRLIWCDATHTSRGEVPQRIIGFTCRDFAREILNVEYPDDDSVSSSLK